MLLIPLRFRVGAWQEAAADRQLTLRRGRPWLRADGRRDDQKTALMASDAGFALVLYV